MCHGYTIYDVLSEVVKTDIDAFILANKRKFTHCLSLNPRQNACPVDVARSNDSLESGEHADDELCKEVEETGDCAHTFSEGIPDQELYQHHFDRNNMDDK